MSDDYIQGWFDDGGSFYYVNEDVEGGFFVQDDTGLHFAFDPDEFKTVTLNARTEPYPIVFTDDSYHIKQIHFRPNGSVKAIDFYTEEEL